MLATPQILQTAVQPTAVIHLVVARSDIARHMGPAIGEVLSTLAAQGMTPAGPVFSLHGRRPSDTFDFEVGVPVAREVLPAGRVRMSRLPALRVARTTYAGGYEGLGAAWGQFLAWVEAQGLVAQQGLWECYVAGPESGPDPANWRTELNLPLVA
jgi:effector-binding domain-containing protein